MTRVSGGEAHFTTFVFAVAKECRRNYIAARVLPRGAERFEVIETGRYPSGQRGQTVNLLAYAFNGSNPFLPTTFNRRLLRGVATIDGQVHAGDVARGVAEQEDDRSAEVVVVRHAAQHRVLGVASEERLGLVVEEAAG